MTGTASCETHAKPSQPRLTNGNNPRRGCHHPGRKGNFRPEGLWLERQPDELFEVAAITVAELWHGVERATGAHKARRLQYLQAVLAPLPIIPYTERTAREHARIWAKLEAAGTMISPYNVIVAATALERCSEVATFNKRHFDCVAGTKGDRTAVSHPRHLRRRPAPPVATPPVVTVSHP